MKVFLFILLMSFIQQSSFKDEQLKYPRVRAAFKNKEATLLSDLKDKKLNVSKLKVYIRAFKAEKILELWVTDNDRYELLKQYSFCATSGNVGPKRKEGDLQIPEGFYHIDRFNPFSNFHLSLGINYPNRSDLVFGDPYHPGSNIFIHGGCATIGCIPITDNLIEEVYILCVLAKSNGQKRVPVTIFPAQFASDTFKNLQNENPQEDDVIQLWKALAAAHDYFNLHQKLPVIQIRKNGSHVVNP